MQCHTIMTWNFQVIIELCRRWYLIVGLDWINKDSDTFLFISYSPKIFVFCFPCVPFSSSVCSNVFFLHNKYLLHFSMSAIDFYCSVDKVKGVDGKDRVVVTFDGKYLPFSEQVRCFHASPQVCSVFYQYICLSARCLLWVAPCGSLN